MINKESVRKREILSDAKYIFISRKLAIPR